WLAGRGWPAPMIRAGPPPLGHGLAVVEEYVDRGTWCDAREPAIRRALATSAHGGIEAPPPRAGSSMLPSQPRTSPPAGALWPPPHSRLFYFEATRAGA